EAQIHFPHTLLERASRFEKACRLLAALLLFAVGLPRLARADSGTAPRARPVRVVLLLRPGLRGEAILRELAAPNLQPGWAPHFGWMSHSTGGPPSLATSCATIGAGRRIARLSELIVTAAAAPAAGGRGGDSYTMLGIGDWPAVRRRAADLP